MERNEKSRYTVIEVEHTGDEGDLLEAILACPNVLGVVEMEYDGHGGYDTLEETRLDKNGPESQRHANREARRARCLP